jgi:hypothetical protein
MKIHWRNGGSVRTKTVGRGEKARRGGLGRQGDITKGAETRRRLGRGMNRKGAKDAKVGGEGARGRWGWINGIRRCFLPKSTPDPFSYPTPFPIPLFLSLFLSTPFPIPLYYDIDSRPLRLVQPPAGDPDFIVSFPNPRPLFPILIPWVDLAQLIS